MTAASSAGQNASCDRPSVSAVGATLVDDAMIPRPKTLEVNASAGEARRLFTNPKVLEAVLLDGEAFAGLLDRDALPESLLDEAPITSSANLAVPTITRGRPLSDAAAVMSAHAMLRLPVVEPDGRTLAGLLCLDHERTGFCQG